MTIGLMGKKEILSSRPIFSSIAPIYRVHYIARIGEIFYKQNSNLNPTEHLPMNLYQRMIRSGWKVPSGAPHSTRCYCKQPCHGFSFITTNSLMFTRVSECYLTTISNIHLFITATQKVLWKNPVLGLKREQHGCSCVSVSWPLPSLCLHRT